MRKCILLACIISVCIILLFGCDYIQPDNQLGNNDWSYELPNEYTIWHVNSRSIICGKKHTENSITNVVEDDIVKFCYNDRYVCMQYVDVSDDLWYALYRRTNS